MTSPNQSEDRRAQSRIPLVVPVTCYSSTPSLEWQARDVSVAGSGMFVATDLLLPVGVEVEIGFRVPGYELEIVTDAVVVRSNDPAVKGFDPTRPKGMGLKFRDLEPEFAKVLKGYVDRRLEMERELASLTEEVPAPRSAAPPASLLEPADLPDLPPLPAELPATPPGPPAAVARPVTPRPPQPAPPTARKAPPPPPPIALPESAPPAPPAAPEPAPPAASPLDAETSIDDLISDSLTSLGVDDPGPSPFAKPEEPAAPPPAPAPAAVPAARRAVTPAPVAPATPGAPAPVVEPEPPLDPEAAALKERLAAGALLGSYRIVQWLGSGGMGDVYLAEHVQLGRKVAIKRLRSEYARNRRALQRFFDEARAVNRIAHENLVQVTDFTGDGPHVYCVMEYLAGATLAQAMVGPKRLPIERVLRIAIAVAEALEVVHRAGTVHRDLKPPNIMLVERPGQAELVKILDFGVAKLKDPEGKISPESTGNALLGTPAYMAPEQLLGNPVDHRADIYALGVILYELVTGHNPFVADTWGQAVVKHATFIPPAPGGVPGAVAPMPGRLETLILQCLEKEPDKRPKRMAEVGLTLRQVQGDLAAGGPALARGVGVARPRRRLAPALTALGAVTALAGAGVVFGPQLLVLAGLGARPVESPPAPVAAPVATPTPASAPIAAPPVEPVAKASPPAKAAPVEPVTKAAPAKATPVEPVTKAASAKTTPVEPPAKAPPAKAAPVEPPTKAPPPEVKPPAEVGAASPADQHFEAAKQLLAENKALLAVEELEQCVQANPKHIRGWRLLGKAYALLGQEAKAIEAFEKVVALAPNHPDADKLRQIIDAYRNR